MLPGSNLTGLTRANDYWIAHTDKKLGTQYLHEDLSGFNIIDCYQSLRNPIRLQGLGRLLRYATDFKPDRFYQSLRNPVQTWQVLYAPMFIESFAWMWISERKTFV